MDKWTKPQYSKRQIDAVGRHLIELNSDSSPYMENALSILNNFRSSHSFPLNTMRTYLQRKSKEIYLDSLVTQRIKRRAAIEHKLLQMNSLKLSKMQDIGGCRAVMQSTDDVQKLVQIYRKSSIKHKLVKHNDYIYEPKKSGYRGHHLIYSYFSDKKETYNGLRIEIQIRSHLQHVWATAVETVGTFTDQAFKSSMGDQDWLRFFALMSAVFAREENSPIIPCTPDDHEDLTQELKRLNESLNIIERLSAYKVITNAVLITNAVYNRPVKKNIHFFVLNLDIKNRTIQMQTFPFSQRDSAETTYLQTEEKIRGDDTKDVVLISTDSVDSIQKAYPNYFSDISIFTDEVVKVIDNT